MANLSWNEISDRATEFASRWQGETYEKGESQSFWSDFLSVFGIDRRRHGAFFEYAIKKGSGAQGYIDMFWPGKLLVEQKSAGKDLSRANLQAYEYLETMPDHDLPEAIVVSDFATFQFVNLETDEKTEFVLADLPRHVKLFAFLLGQTSRNIAEQDPVNRKAAESMARLHNQLRDDNYTGRDLYDPLTMPPALVKAHKALDRAVDRLYRPEPFATDADRVSMLFEKYQEVIK